MQEQEDEMESSENKTKSDKKSELEKIMVVTEIHLVVTTLLITVTFAVSFMLPGGFESDPSGPYKGLTILARNTTFCAFVVSDAIAFTCSAGVVFSYFFIAANAVATFSCNCLCNCNITQAQKRVQQITKPNKKRTKGNKKPATQFGNEGPRNGDGSSSSSQANNDLDGASLPLLSYICQDLWSLREAYIKHLQVSQKPGSQLGEDFFSSKDGHDLNKSATSPFLIENKRAIVDEFIHLKSS
ncbi:hypothetical protein RDI58_017921 [Solanum bulbocastanum]|uniref:PGG domain-containing protein n=1 Tax=Solanum bulbocastanum TaxID=147425 RepID=A0AAN8YAF6_SOLBU